MEIKNVSRSLTIPTDGKLDIKEERDPLRATLTQRRYIYITFLFSLDED